MSRIVTALFASRGEAEAARGRLAAAVKVESARVIAQDTAGALVGMSVDSDQLNRFREALARGDFLLVANVAWGADPGKIVAALGQLATEKQPDEGPRLSYSIGPADGEQSRPGEDRPAAVDAPVREPAAEARIAAVAEAPPETAAAPMASASVSRRLEADVVADEPLPADVGGVAGKPPTPAGAGYEVRIGNRQIARGGSDASLMNVDAVSGFESRAPSRRLTDEEVQSSGLLKERVIEVVEMREEPVIAREVVVREEVLIRKTASERTKTINQSLRLTDVEREELQQRR